MEPENNLQKNIGIFLGILVVLGVLFVTIFWGRQSSVTTTLPSAPLLNQVGDGSGNTQPVPKPTPAPTPVVTQTPPVDTPKKSASLYKDGTYSATGSYMSPGGEDQIAVTLTLKNDIITSASVVTEPGDRTSQRYQNMFVAGYQQYVVGQNIAKVYLARVSGSSLTPKGFDDALAQIKVQAMS